VKIGQGNVRVRRLRRREVFGVPKSRRVLPPARNHANSLRGTSLALEGFRQREHGLIAPAK
jgi:hypothetical protein